MSRWIVLLLIVTLPSAALAQSAARLAAWPNSGTTVMPLAAVYAIRLTSAWPESAASERCRNGGQEVLVGSLVRQPDGGFRGVLSRTSVISFCGVHAQATEGCSLTLNGTGVVDVVGVPLVEGGRAALRIMWVPRAEGSHSETSGDCPPAFSDSLREMLQRAGHSLELALPLPGRKNVERLEDAGWVVEVE